MLAYDGGAQIRASARSLRDAGFTVRTKSRFGTEWVYFETRHERLRRSNAIRTRRIFRAKVQTDAKGYVKSSEGVRFTQYGEVIRQYRRVMRSF